MRMTFTASLLALVVALVACRSDPVHYQTLTPLLQAPPSFGVGQELQVERVSVPPQVDRSPIVVRQGGNELVILETEWWAASLADELRNALTNHLNALPGASHKGWVRVEVQRFDLVPGQYALMDVRWRIRLGLHGSENVSELSCRSLLRTPAGTAISQLVVAQQENLHKLAIAISEAGRTGARQCPVPTTQSS